MELAESKLCAEAAASTCEELTGSVMTICPETSANLPVTVAIPNMCFVVTAMLEPSGSIW
jgi:hypothetical protein